MAQRSEESLPIPGKRRWYPWEDWMDGATWELTRGVDFGAGIASFRNRCYTKASGSGMNATVNVGFMIDGEWLPTKDYDEQLVIADPRLHVALEHERETHDFAWYGVLEGKDADTDSEPRPGVAAALTAGLGNTVVWARDPTGDLFAANASDVIESVGYVAAASTPDDPRVTRVWVPITADAWSDRFPQHPVPPPLVVKVRFFVHDEDENEEELASHPVAA